ncbi:hypothetical protein [Aquimarina celericrescens]|uniref:Uncharacterized protein n=1 Tax=Aquimarina celericrescens TaxID=1964542 RepID=A0ABW5ATK2_9FLAO|nr:hypothetical protein [Aquimarina celericrescens]
MKTATIKEIKSELSQCTHQEIIELCLRLSRFKKENKELLTYLLFESTHEEGYIENIKSEVDEQFEAINTVSYYYIKKSIRKILRTIKKYIRYSKNKETEIELLLHFCQKLKDFKPSIQRNNVLKNIYLRELEAVKKKVKLLHEDLQYDYELELESLS